MFLTDKFCYISISRTGTRSVLKMLDKLLEKYNSYVTGAGMYHPEKNSHKLKKYDINSFHMMNDLFKEAKLPFTFTFVRNPYDRSLSLYNHAIKDKWFTGSFIEYLDTVNSYFTDPTRNKHKDKVIGQEGFINIIQEAIPQYYYLFKEDGSTNVDFIGRYERLNEDWDKLCTIFKTKLNLNLDNKLPLLNERGDSCYNINSIDKCFSLKYDETNKHHTSETKKLIYEIYKKDFELLNYDKDNVSLKTEINFKIEKIFNDSYFNLFNSRDEKDEKIKYKLCLDLFDNLKNAFPEAEKSDLVSMHLNNMKMMVNDQKIHYLLSKAVICSMHIFPKYPM